MISTKYVSGDIRAAGDELIGMKRGLMNTSGNLMRIVRTMVFPGVSVEGTERMRLKLANASPATIMPRAITNGFIVRIVDKNIAPNMSGTRLKSAP
jgi:hypothetical protein